MLKAFVQHIHRYGRIKITVPDQAKNVDASVFTQLCEEKDAEKRRYSPCHPEGNGLAETSIQKVKELMCVRGKRNREI